jgi:hypothetical protein
MAAKVGRPRKDNLLTRVCNECDIEKNSDEFHKNKAICKSCRNNKARKYYQLHQNDYKTRYENKKLSTI